MDLTSTDLTVLAPNTASLLLSADTSFPTQVTAQAGAPGTASIQVTPRLFESPLCVSDPITVTE